MANLATCGHSLCPYVIMVHHVAPCPCCTVLAHVWFHLLCNSNMLNFFSEEAIWLKAGRTNAVTSSTHGCVRSYWEGYTKLAIAPPFTHNTTAALEHMGCATAVTPSTHGRSNQNGRVSKHGDRSPFTHNIRRSLETQEGAGRAQGNPADGTMWHDRSTCMPHVVQYGMAGTYIYICPDGQYCHMWHIHIPYI